MLSAETIERIYDLLFQATIAIACGVATIIAILVVLAFLQNAAEAIADAAAHE
jgi:hypothetical protein